MSYRAASKTTSDTKSSGPKWPRGQNFGLEAKVASRPKFWPRPRPRNFGLGLAAVSRFWPRPCFDLVVLLCNGHF